MSRQVFVIAEDPAKVGTWPSNALTTEMRAAALAD
jgi:hypothetical protein